MIRGVKPNERGEYCGREITSPEQRNEIGHAAVLRTALVAILGSALDSGDDNRSLVELGLDSVGAIDMVDLLRRQDVIIDYARLISGATLAECATSLRSDADCGPSAHPHRMEWPICGAQLLWAQLADDGWEAWANVSACISVPAWLVSPERLAAMAQALCDANDALRMRLVRTSQGGDDAALMQRRVHTYRLPVRITQLTSISLAKNGEEKQAMRLVEAFEAETRSPFTLSASALVLAAAETEGRHWLTICMHHAFADREGLHALQRQLFAMLSSVRRRAADALPTVVEPPLAGFAECAAWMAERAARDAGQARLVLHGALQGVTLPPLVLGGDIDLGELSIAPALRPAETGQLAALAGRLGTTVPMLLHTLFAPLVARLIRRGRVTAHQDEDPNTSPPMALLCHVVANRDGCEALRGVLGCADTSVPVAVPLRRGEPLRSLAARTRATFAAALPHAAALPRGDFLRACGGGLSPLQLIERTAHLHVTHVD